jgi:hypothetical protein
MSVGNSGVRAHDQAQNATEGVRQTAVAAASSQSAVKTAEITFHRAVVKSALANGVSPSASMQALHELGVTGQ